MGKMESLCGRQVLRGEFLLVYLLKSKAAFAFEWLFQRRLRAQLGPDPCVVWKVVPKSRARQRILLDDGDKAADDER